MASCLDREGRGPAWAVITAAGSSVRMGGGPKKEYRLLEGRPVMAHTLQAFLATCLFGGVVVTVPPGDKERAKEILEDACGGDTPVLFTEGGETRQRSVFLGLRACLPFEPSIVLVHDGARPWISPELIRAVYQGALSHGGCIPVFPSTEAMKQLDPQGFISQHLDRPVTVAAQTPQGFAFRPLLEAHEAALTDGMTYVDDAEIYDRYVGRVFTVAGAVENKKITFAQDLGRPGAAE